jgi:hypothetical protein
VEVPKHSFYYHNTDPTIIAPQTTTEMRLSSELQ